MGDTLLLNNAPQTLATPRSQACLQSLRSLRAELEAADPTLPRLSALPLRLVSANNFPTAAGLASSAAGFAALVRAVADLYKLPQSPTELSLIARQGSGSACRSLLGGYVAWDAGTKKDGSDSCARVVAERNHWAEMRALILVASASEKAVSSTAGMQTTVATSKLFRTRADIVVPQAMKEMEKAIFEKDFETFARVTMQESNSFHATCLDTRPAIHYLNDVSFAAMDLVELINKQKTVCAYTFDAGPNAVIYYLTSNEGVVLGNFKAALSGKDGFDVPSSKETAPSPEAGSAVEETLRRGVTRVIMTSVGDGPISVEDHLVDSKGDPAHSH